MRVRPTRGTDLVGPALAGGIAAALLVNLATTGEPSLPTSAPISVVLVAGAVAVTARSTRSRLASRPGTRPLAPLAAARLVALAKAGSVAGVLVAGGWAGVLSVVLDRLGSPAPRGGAAVAVAAVATVAGLALTAASLMLERVCRLPPEDPTGGGASGGSAATPGGDPPSR